MSTIWPYLAAVIPTIVVAIIFYFLIKSMLEGDRRERLAQSKFEAEQDRRAQVKHTAAPANTPTTRDSETDAP
jgi:NADH:ubiquinone oxidoreductase subunit 3 (subunit A)